MSVNVLCVALPLPLDGVNIQGCSERAACHST